MPLFRPRHHLGELCPEKSSVEPYSTYLDRWHAPTSTVSRAAGLVFVSGMPPFDPDSGAIVDGPIERQTELVLEQMKRCLETAGTSMDHILKVNVFCSARRCSGRHEVYTRYFPDQLWTGRFDIEVDCVATVI